MNTFRNQHAGRRHKTLALESLEQRRLLASSVLYGAATTLYSYEPDYDSVSLDAGTLTIRGTEAADVAEVRTLRTWWPRLAEQLEVTLGDTTTRYAREDVDRIRFYGYGGDDRFDNDSRVDSTIDGGRGNDELYGGSGRDTILGAYGNDLLVGRGNRDDLVGGPGDDEIHGLGGNDHLDGDSGHDQLYGGEGSDFLRGDAGDDLLRGEGDADFLLGGTGNDRLYGGDGADWLSGDNDDDGLFGGLDSVADRMYSGSGDDRFLVGDAETETIADQSGHDVRVTFSDGPGGSRSFTGVSGTFDFEAGHWAQNEVELIDRALSELVARTGNNRLLETATGGQLEYQRWGRQTTRLDEFVVGGWSNSTGSIALTQLKFDGTDDGVAQTVFHEVGHNWDTENPDWEDFKAISGWTNVDPHSADYRQAENQGEDWWYLSTATFARSYGHRNPMEDYATSFAAYFMEQAGWTYNGGVGGATAIPEKTVFLDTYMDSIS